jgi:hypothetical protein
MDEKRGLQKRANTFPGKIKVCPIKIPSQQIRSEAYEENDETLTSLLRLKYASYSYTNRRISRGNPVFLIRLLNNCLMA